MAQNIPCATALELKKALANIPDEVLEKVDICIDEADIESEDGIEIEFDPAFPVMTILGHRI